MAIIISHPFVSTKPDGTDDSLVQPSAWNDDHAVTGTLEVANGGTGANSAANARTNLGLGTVATQNSNNVSITGGSIAGVTISSLDANTTFQDNTDPTKQMQFELSSIAGGQTSVLTVPDADGTVALLGNKLSDFAATTSAELAGVISDETGSGALVFGTSPTLTTPVLGVATATSINKVAITAPATGSTLTVADGKTLTASNTLTLAGTDSTTLTFQGTDTYVGRATTDTLTNKTLTNPSFSGATANMGTVTTIDINGGTIDGTTIGASTRAAGNFTTLDANGNVTLGDASTDTVTVSGYVGVGGAGSASAALYTTNAALTGTSQLGIWSNITATSAATTSVRAFQSAPGTAAASFTTSYVAGFQANDVTKGAGSTITAQYGVLVNDQTQGTNNYGITSLVSSGTNKWNIYASGTASNYFAGKIGLKTTPNANWTSSAAVIDTLTSHGAFGSIAGGPVDHAFVATNSYAVSGDPGLTAWRRKTLGAASLLDIRSGAFYLKTAGSAAADIDITWNTALTITAAGNVGVGTTAPGVKLKVETSSGSDITALAQNTNTAYGASWTAVDDTGAKFATIGVLNSATTLQSTTYGVAGDAFIRASTNATGLVLNSASATGYIRFQIGSGGDSERMRIDSAGNVLQTQPEPAAVNTTATLTVANLRTRIITSTTAALVTGTLPLGTDMDTSLYSAATDMGYDWSVINTGATNNFVIAGNGAGHTFVGNTTVSPATSALFRSRRTTANTWITYRIG
jgi:hypothetical protein